MVHIWEGLCITKEGIWFGVKFSIRHQCYYRYKPHFLNYLYFDLSFRQVQGGPQNILHRGPQISKTATVQHKCFQRLKLRIVNVQKYIKIYDIFPASLNQTAPFLQIFNIFCLTQKWIETSEANTLQYQNLFFKLPEQILCLFYWINAACSEEKLFQVYATYNSHCLISGPLAMLTSTVERRLCSQVKILNPRQFWVNKIVFKINKTSMFCKNQPAKK